MACKGWCKNEKLKRAPYFQVGRDNHTGNVLLDDNGKPVFITYKYCTDCGYCKRTDELQCYCCSNRYRYKPHGGRDNLRMKRIEYALINTGKRRIE